MKTNPRLDKVLSEVSNDPSYIKEIIPVIISFINYGGADSYQHYIDRINEVCQKWQNVNKLAAIVPKLIEAYFQFCFGEYERSRLLISKIYAKYDLKIDSDHYAFAECLLGVCKRDRGDLDEALVHFMNASKYLKKDSPIIVFKCYANYLIAEIHMQIDEIDAAGRYYKKSLKIAQRLNQNVSLFRSLIGLGSWHRIRNNYKKSIHYFNRALKVKPITNASRARILCDIGIHYYYIKNYKKAISFLEESYELAIENGFSNPASTSLIQMGKVYLKLNDHTVALAKLKEALEISKKHNTRAKQMEIQALLGEAHEGLRNYEKAYEHLKNARELENIIRTENQRKIFKIKNKMIEEQKEIIQKERDRSDKLLLNILPVSIAAELKENQIVEPKRYEDATVLFADFVGFTKISETLSSEELVKSLDAYFSAFDKIILKNKLEKIKTIGDAYMCAGGVPSPSPAHALDIVKAAFEMQNFVNKNLQSSKIKKPHKWKLRIGVHSGPIIAGVVGNIKFAYDIWGDTVNLAARMESSGAAGKVNISQSTYEILKDTPELRFESRGKIKAKNKGEMEMYFVECCGDS